MDQRDRVKPGQEIDVGRAEDERTEGGGIGADAADRPDIEGDDAAGRVESEPGRARVVAGVAVARERFRAGRGPADRRRELARRPHQNRFFRIVALHPEAAADVGSDDAERVLGNTERMRGDPAPHQVRRLRRRPQRRAAGERFVIGEVGARLDRVGGDAVVDEVEGLDMRCAGERGLHRGGVAHGLVECEVGRELGMDQRRVGRERRPRRYHRRHRPVVDRDRFGGGGGLGPSFGDHHRDRIADVAGDARRETGAERLVHRPAIGERDAGDARQPAQAFARPVGAGQDRADAGHRRGAGAIDRADRGVGVGAADENSVEWCRRSRRDVVDEAAASGQEAVVFAAQDGLADEHRHLPNGKPMGSASEATSAAARYKIAAMIAVLEVLIVVALIAVLAVLGVGLVSMFRGGAFNKKYGNYLMRARVATQGAAILLILAYYLATR